MGFAALFSAALGLSADAFTAAVCKGLGMKRRFIHDALVIALFFGSFQAVMPVVGWLLGSVLQRYIYNVNHLISFLIFTFLGVKMVYDSFNDDTQITVSGKLDLAELLALAIATSIDALALGVTFAFLDVNILTAAVLIGTVTFCLSILGVYAGFRFGTRFDGHFSALGGFVLILLGIHELFC